jgi:crotonobetainyl-CoA:carnitine CoA-transferase CaiB-like acyl-CoA transferase
MRSGRCPVTDGPPLPLSGVGVLDCSRLLPCAYGTQLLADLGAEVVKVEQPGGEIGRHHERFPTVNRHKSSVVLDLKSPQGRADLLGLVAACDVLLESFRPGVMDAWGLGYDTLGTLHPRLVYVSSTGYAPGSATPNRPGHDANYLAVAGALQPRVEDDPVQFAIPVGDLATGMMTALVTVAAVMHARSTGQGQHVSTSMADISLSLAAVGAGLIPPLHPEAVAGLRTWPDVPLGRFPCYGCYRTADHRYVTLGNIERKFWDEFLAITGLTALADAQFATGPEADSARARIAEVIGSRTLADWEEVFEGREVCFAPVRTVREAMTAPDVVARGLVEVTDGDLLIAALPATFSATPARRGGTAPAAGRDNRLLLGRDADQPAASPA